MYLLDTNICIALLNARPDAIVRFSERANLCYLSTVTVAELFKGVYCSTRIAENRQRLQDFIHSFPIVPLDLSAAEEFGRIQADLRRIGRPTGDLDALIAAIARSRRDTVVTDNLRHFEHIADLQVENWLTSLGT